MLLVPLLKVFVHEFLEGFFHGAIWVPSIACIGGITRGMLRALVTNVVLITLDSRFRDNGWELPPFIDSSLDLITAILGEVVPSILLARILPDVAPFLEIAVAPSEETSETCAFLIIFVIMCVQQSITEFAWKIDDDLDRMEDQLDRLRGRLRIHPLFWVANDEFRGLQHHNREETQRLMERRVQHVKRRIKNTQHEIVMLNMAHSCIWETHISLTHCIHGRVRARWPNQIWDLVVLPQSVRAQRPQDTTALGRSAYWLLSGLRLARNCLFLPMDGYGYYSTGADLVLHPLMLFIYWDAMGGQQQALGGRALIGRRTDPAQRHRRMI